MAKKDKGKHKGKDSKRSHRARMTVVPLAANLGLTINSDFENEKESKLAEELFKPKYAGQTILISWHHGTVQSLAHELKVAHAPKWKEAYDRIWEIAYDEDRKATLRVHPRQLLTQDSEK